MVRIRPATAADDPAIAALFAAYAREYAYHLGPQDVEGEGRRARTYYQDGGVLVAEVGGQVVGCVCFEPWDAPRCRMKRMVVTQAVRGQGVGRALGEAVLDAAREKGFTSMCLDTTRPMVAAERLYRTLGFAPFDPDYEAPCRDVLYMRRELSASR